MLLFSLFFKLLPATRGQLRYSGFASSESHDFNYIIQSMPVSNDFQEFLVLTWHFTASCLETVGSHQKYDTFNELYKCCSVALVTFKQSRATRFQSFIQTLSKLASNIMINRKQTLESGKSASISINAALLLCLERYDKFDSAENDF